MSSHLNQPFSREDCVAFLAVAADIRGFLSSAHDNLEWPSWPKHLRLGYEFSRPIDKIDQTRCYRLPLCNRYAPGKECANQPTDRAMGPTSLETLRYGELFNQARRGFTIWTVTLKYLHIQFCGSQTLLPPVVEATVTEKAEAAQRER